MNKLFEYLEEPHSQTALELSLEVTQIVKIFFFNFVCPSFALSFLDRNAVVYLQTLHNLT